MNNIKYFIQYIFFILLFFIYKLIGLKYSRILSALIFRNIGPFFRSRNLAQSNLINALPKTKHLEREKILKNMWSNYGKILAEYMFLKDFRNRKKFYKNIKIKNIDVLEKIKLSSKPVIFISGHFNNFELMAMQIDKFGIDLSTIYRPLNNKYLNPLMEKIRKNYICNNQIKKGISGTKELLRKFRSGSSVALMIDQRVSEGRRSSFFNKKAFTTTIPAQFVKKFNADIVPVYIKRTENDEFILQFYNPIKFSSQKTVDAITLELNSILEKMILEKPEQWIWTHNRWK